MMTSYLNSDPGGLCFSKPYQFPPHDGWRVGRRSPQKLINKISADNGTCVCAISTKILQRVLNVLHVDFAPRPASSNACILFNKHRADRPEHKDIRGGTQGAAKRGRFARSGSCRCRCRCAVCPCPCPSPRAKGPPIKKKKIGDPRGGRVRSQKRTRVRFIF